MISHQGCALVRCPDWSKNRHNPQNNLAHAMGPDGRLFWGARNGGRISSSVYGRAWARARVATFTADVVNSPLAKRPYGLRHACVSTWLTAGVEATRVAEWAGHSVGVLMRVYAKFLDQGEQSSPQARRRGPQGLLRAD